LCHRQSKVENCMSALGDEDVGGLDVTVDDVFCVSGDRLSPLPCSVLRFARNGMMPLSRRPCRIDSAS
jgi:hypothetical protein